MKISSGLIVGNVWLHMLQSDEAKTTFLQEEFLAYAKKIDEIVSSNPDCIAKGEYVSVSLGDILDEAACFLSCVKMERRPGDECPSVLRLVDGKRETLIRKLEIYDKGITPQWLLDTITLALESQ